MVKLWKPRLLLGLFVSGMVVPLFSGCSSVPPHQQRLVSKPNMLFNDSGAFVYQSKMWLQTEPGLMFSGGARAVGCSACAQ
ncbi:MAG: hypothetical protein HYY23_13260 [Verrucomicrobia bacterium]|nr:hypothetical protein [Verrucomicrobiota bacterium]